MSVIATSNRIRKLRWQLRAASEKEAFTLRRDLRKQWEDLLIPVFEKACNAACEKNQVLHIPKITLHLKIDSEESLATQLPEQLYEALKQALPSQTNPASKTASPLSTESGVLDHSQSPFDETLSKFSSEDEDHFAAFVTYLQTGIVPWHMAHLPASEIATHFKKILSSDQQKIFDVLDKHPEQMAFYFRLLQLYSDKEIVAFVEQLSKSSPKICSERCAQALSLLFRPSQMRLSRHSLLRLAAAFLSEGHARGDSAIPSFLALASKVLNKADRVIFEESVSKLTPESARLFYDEKQADEPLSEKLRVIRPEFVSLESRVIFSGTNQVEREQIEKTQTLSPITQTHKNEVASKQGFSTLTVKHAGLILLHPFLSRLFSQSGFTTFDQKTLSPVGLPKAAAVLHFLASGLETVYEHELGLIKVLLGLQPEMPLLVSEGLLEEADKNEALTLLEATIQHWSILKNTPVAGLRTTFLARQGLLKKEDAAWRLHIERKTFDVLLDQLPWSIGIVKLPWMKQPLYTEW